MASLVLWTVASPVTACQFQFDIYFNVRMAVMVVQWVYVDVVGADNILWFSLLFSLWQKSFSVGRGSGSCGQRCMDWGCHCDRIKLHAVVVAGAFIYSDHDDANDDVDEMWTSWEPTGQSFN
uniref:HDC17349 n=1 Tax=Drosophila melanogaster TaxID=7227 RepID=Q6IIQ5_DROME|nr:TPA_inf: HDC17349 [Drosophila melanogaster]